MIFSKRLIILSIFCTILLSGCNRTPRRKVKKIRLTSDQKQKAQLLRKIDKNFTDSEAHFQLGRLYHKDGLWVKAEYEYNTALGLNPVHRRAQAAMAGWATDCHQRLGHHGGGRVLYVRKRAVPETLPGRGGGDRLAGSACRDHSVSDRSWHPQTLAA